jgi:hypothetical protein
MVKALGELDHLFLFFFLIEKKNKKSLNKGVATNGKKEQANGRGQYGEERTQIT